MEKGLLVLLLVVSRRARLTIYRWTGSCSSRRGGEWLARIVRRGKYVPCWLGPPCKVKSNRFAVSRSRIWAPWSLRRSVVLWSKNGYIHIDEHMNYYLLFHYVCSRFGYANIRLCNLYRTWAKIRNVRNYFSCCFLQNKPPAKSLACLGRWAKLYPLVE